jgi:hypothetical protein
MVAYNFKQRFVRPIRVGLGLESGGVPKLQTIRALRMGTKTRHARPGEQMQLYWAMRTKQCELIGLGLCISVSLITINFIPELSDVLLYDGFRTANQSHLDTFAKNDGFCDWQELREFWAKEHPGISMFSGMLLKWKPITAG